MPGTTATQGLIYPVDGDRMCDGAIQFELLAKGMNARYVLLDSTIDLAEEPPALLVEWVGEDSAEPLANGNITWNTVGVDDAGAYDAALSANTVTLPYTAPGQLWEIGMYARGRWADTAVTEQEFRWTLRITSQAGTVLYDLNSTLTNNNLWGVSGGGSQTVLHETTGNDVIAVDWSTFQDGAQLEFAQLWAYRIGEA